MEINLVEMWTHMGLPVKAVVIVLTIQAVACISATIDRMILLRLSYKRSRKYALEARKKLDSGDYEGLVELSDKAKGSHLAEYLGAGLRAYVDRLKKGRDNDKAVTLARRALERKGEAIGQDLNRFMNVLASTGSTAPFVGLLGTVLGIINAFKMIAATGAGGIGTIGAAIGEALVVTGYGLVVAIPSVLIFNWLSGKISTYESSLLDAGGEMVDELDGRDGTLGGVDPDEEEHTDVKKIRNAELEPAATAA
jgi:biopolymer transport protein ExbB/TolQ